MIDGGSMSDLETSIVALVKKNGFRGSSYCSDKLDVFQTPTPTKQKATYQHPSRVVPGKDTYFQISENGGNDFLKQPLKLE